QGHRLLVEGVGRVRSVDRCRVDRLACAEDRDSQQECALHGVTTAFHIVSRTMTMRPGSRFHHSKTTPRVRHCPLIASWVAPPARMSISWRPPIVLTRAAEPSGRIATRPTPPEDEYRSAPESV